MKRVHASNKNSIAAIVVTHNRKEMVANCIKAILGQTLSCDIIVVDNASTDGTKVYLSDPGVIGDDRIHCLCLKENLGGAGGFHHGLKYAMSHPWNWFWLMDDDAEPESSALDNLVRHAIDSNTIYGSAPVGIENGKKRLCWTMTAIEREEPIRIKDHESLQDLEPVKRMPFLGFFIHRDLVNRVGLPDPSFFIYNDDNDYCERARKRGVKFILVKNSIIIHPLQRTSIYPFLGRTIQYRSMPPWKIYYQVRNTISLTKRHHPGRLWSKTLPHILLRFPFTVLSERNKKLCFHAYAMGFIHGLSGKTGRRFLP